MIGNNLESPARPEASVRRLSHFCQTPGPRKSTPTTPAASAPSCTASRPRRNGCTHPIFFPRNALRAGLVVRAEDWRWSSPWQRGQGLAGGNEEWPLLAAGPLPWPRRWRETVNRPETGAELAALRQSLARGWPLGDGPWTAAMTRRLGLPAKLRPRGRPRKPAGAEPAGGRAG